MSNIEQVVDGIRDLIDKNLVAKSNVISDVLTGQILINVQNTFHFSPDQEIILIDYGYNDEASPHYQIFEYSRVKEVHNTHWMTLYQQVESDWLMSQGAFIQKTIGSIPLYSDLILYGDRDVISTEDMAITVEPLSESSEWLYIHGGLSNEYRVSIMVYGKNIDTEEGIRIQNKYTDAISELFNRNIHIDINNWSTPVLTNVAANTRSIVIANTLENREHFKLSSQTQYGDIYEIQDNMGVEIDLYISKIQYDTPIAGQMTITVNQDDLVQHGIEPLNRSYSLEEYPFFSAHGRYFYDSRVDNIEYGMVQKGSAYVRAARLSWFGKEINEYHFPQQSYRIDQQASQT